MILLSDLAGKYWQMQKPMALSGRCFTKRPISWLELPQNHRGGRTPVSKIFRLPVYPIISPTRMAPIAIKEHSTLANAKTALQVC